MTAVALCRGSSQVLPRVYAESHRQKSASLVFDCLRLFGDLQFPLRWFGGNRPFGE